MSRQASWFRASTQIDLLVNLYFLDPSMDGLHIWTDVKVERLLYYGIDFVNLTLTFDLLPLKVGLKF